MRTRKTTITVEAHQLLVVRRGVRFAEDWCTQCGQRVRLVTVDEAALLTSDSTRKICRSVEEGRVHFKETGDGLLLICLNSLTQ